LSENKTYRATDFLPARQAGTPVTAAEEFEVTQRLRQSLLRLVDGGARRKYDLALRLCPQIDRARKAGHSWTTIAKHLEAEEPAIAVSISPRTLRRAYRDWSLGHRAVASVRKTRKPRSATGGTP
jgi:hypothetical protein